MPRLEILNPVAATVEHSVKPAPRRADLRGATVGLYWNMKSGGDAALDETERLLRARFPDTRFRRYTGSVGFLMRPIGGDTSLHDLEFDEVRWVPVGEALKMMTYANEVRILRQAVDMIRDLPSEAAS